jgi:hypothetical protein
MITAIAVTSCVLALIPAVLFVRNLKSYEKLPFAGAARSRCSILIPARNEEDNIADALRSILRCEGVEFEIIVLDDDSSDRTAGIVQEFAAADSRVRLEAAKPLPRGWCGKPFACQQLAAFARHPLLIFLDADVRVSRSDSLSRLAGFINDSGAALVSGVPREETFSLMEKLIIPLIHFVLLGFLPLRRMRSGTDPKFAAACGQIIAVRREAYETAGGHSAISDRLHDGVALARSFRRHNLLTDLFDATDTFHCRMYRSASEVWNGFAKNAHEALASPHLIVPSTLFLIGGQVLPILVLIFATSRISVFSAAIGTIAVFLPRFLGVVRFQQSAVGALLHPAGICVLAVIQWFAFLRFLGRRPSVWKGRAYTRTAAP